MLKNKYKIGYLLIILLLAACASPTVTSAPAAQPRHGILYSLIYFQLLI